MDPGGRRCVHVSRGVVAAAARVRATALHVGHNLRWAVVRCAVDVVVCVFCESVHACVCVSVRYCVCMRFVRHEHAHVWTLAEGAASTSPQLQLLSVPLRCLLATTCAGQ